jgi:protein-tyrosine kinase
MSRMQDSRNRPEDQRDFIEAVDAEPERTNGASTLHQLQPGPAPTESMTRDTVLAGCPRRSWTPDPATMLSFGGSEPAHGTEVFRALRSRLYQLQAKNPLKSLLVASAAPKEGRSFVAANLAQVMALQQECRVLLIDADLRSPRLHFTLGTSLAPGFSEYLLQEVEEFGIMQKGSAENLFFIPSGRAVTGPTELVANGRLKSLIDRVEPLFDWIIIDSPPAVQVSDACLLANYCDGVLMVVRSDSTPFDIVRKARERFREESLVGVVLNVVETSSTPDVRSSGFRLGSEVRG